MGLGDTLRAAAATADTLTGQLAAAQAQEVADAAAITSLQGQVSLLQQQLSAAATPPPLAAKLGVSFGGYHSLARVQQFETFLGRKVGIVGVFTEETDMPGLALAGHRMLSSPKWHMSPTPTPDSAILAFCQQLVANGRANEIIRPMWEANGSWMTNWLAIGHETAWIARYVHIVDLARSVPGQRFQFEWNVNVTTNNPTQVLAFQPPVDHFDICGMDVYSKYPTGQWETAASGLAWLKAHAASIGKPYAFSEFAVSSSDDTAYMATMAKYVNDPACAYALWQEYDDYAPDLHYLEGGLYPGATSALKVLP